jgi:hypothetical protein
MGCSTSVRIEVVALAVFPLYRILSEKSRSALHIPEKSPVLLLMIGIMAEKKINRPVSQTARLIF